MNAVTFDTMEYARQLREAGFSPDQAEAMTQAQRIAPGQLMENRELASKRDLLELEQRLSERIAQGDQKLAEEIAAVDKRLSERIADVEQRLSERISDVEQRLSLRLEQARSDLIRWLTGSNMALAAFLVAVLAFLK